MNIKTILYWIWSWTWGLPATLFGAIVSIICLCQGKKPKHYKGAIYFEAFGEDWGGFEAGCFFFVDENTNLSIVKHEWGHSIQNLILGPLMPFVVDIPSAIRYWFREYVYKYDESTYKLLPPYDAFWVEAWATTLGTKYYKKGDWIE